MTPALLSLVLTCLLESDNLAIGKGYRLEPPPNYEHCTEAGDRTQLTDGNACRATSGPRKGRSDGRAASHVIITIDLGAVKPISGVSLHTAAGVAGVELPQAIVVLVSDDGTRWREAGDLVAASRSQQAHAGYAEHLLRADNLATRGRYVAFLVEASGAFVFADEIKYTVAPTLCSRQRSPVARGPICHPITRQCAPGGACTGD